MRVILEKADIISLLGKAMRRKLTETDVEITADPFEVIIHDATDILGDIEQTPAAKPQPPFPLEGTSAFGSISTYCHPEEEEMSLEDIARESAKLAAQPPLQKKKTRRLMSGESLEPRNPLAGVDDGD